MTNGMPVPVEPGSLDALVQEAVQRALASPQIMTVPGAQMSITGKLGLKMPALDDPALVTDLNDNFLVLDDCILVDQQATLTNKTIDHGVLLVPTIDDFSLAQHTHQDAAGGGALDGAAIATGTVGTGLLVRESAAGGGGPGTVVDQPVLLDPTVRDTLYFGPTGTGPVDVTLVRNAAGNGLALNGSPVITQALGDARYLTSGTAVGNPAGPTIAAESLTPVGGCDPEFRQAGSERYELVYAAGANGYASINLSFPQTFAGGAATFRVWTWSATAQTATWRVGGVALGDNSNPDQAWGAIADQSVTYAANQMRHSDHVWGGLPATYAGTLATLYFQCLAPPAAVRLRCISVRFG